MMRAPKLVGVQYLRAIAALMVVYYHTFTQIPEYAETLSANGAFDIPRWRTGVDLFFVISGFVMWASQHSTPVEFVRRRLIRIVPLYWLLTGLIVIAALISPSAFRYTQANAVTIAKSLLFIPYTNSTGGLFPIVAPGWTLNYEMFFYALFAVALFMRHRLALMGAVLGLLALLNSVAHSFYTNPIILEFWCGMLIGYAYDRGWFRTTPLALSAGLIVAGFTGLLTPIWADSLALDLLSATAILTGLVAIEQTHGLPDIGVLALLGDASYSLYLTHLYILRVLHIVWVRLFPDNPWCFAVVAMAIMSVAAVAVFRIVEKPISLAFKRAKPRAGVAAVSPG